MKETQAQPIREDGRIVGAVGIFRNRTEVTRLAEDLTGVKHMVEAMRASTHEFMNKLHAEAYILEVTGIQREAAGFIMEHIQGPSLAALLVGKTSRCAELGIRLRLAPESRLSAEEVFLPSAAYVTILGNLIENAVDALNQTPRPPRAFRKRPSTVCAKRCAWRVAMKKPARSSRAYPASPPSLSGGTCPISHSWGRSQRA